MKLRSIGFTIIGLIFLAGCAEKEKPAPSSTTSAAVPSLPVVAAADAGIGASPEAARAEALCAAERQNLTAESGKCPDYAWSPSAANGSTTPLVGTPKVFQSAWHANQNYGDVETKMRGAFPKFLACYQPTKQRVEGLINVHFSTRDTGVVEKAFATKETTIPDPAVIECVVREVRGLKISGPARVEYTLRFASDTKR